MVNIQYSIIHTVRYFLIFLTQSLGQLGRMERLLDSGSAVVKVNGRRFRMDPLCLTPAPGEQLHDEEGVHCITLSNSHTF